MNDFLNDYVGHTPFRLSLYIIFSSSKKIADYSE